MLCCNDSPFSALHVQEDDIYIKFWCHLRQSQPSLGFLSLCTSVPLWYVLTFLSVSVPKCSQLAFMSCLACALTALIELRGSVTRDFDQNRRLFILTLSSREQNIARCWETLAPELIRQGFFFIRIPSQICILKINLKLKIHKLFLSCTSHSFSVLYEKMKTMNEMAELIWEWI